MATEQASLPLIFAAPSVIAFADIEPEHVNGCQATKCIGSKQVARLMANFLFALALQKESQSHEPSNGVRPGRIGKAI